MKNLDPDKIKANLKTKYVGSNIVVFNSTSSTNDIAGEYAKNPANNGLAILAENQEKGRGRAANKWLSKSGQSILCSIVLTKSDIEIELLSLAIAVAVAETVGGNAKVKWPNDILINDKKISGILIESKKFPTHNAGIIGIGINCHQQRDDFPAAIRKGSTSIDMETQSTCNRNIVVKRLLTSVEHWLEIAETDSKKVIRKWKKLSTVLHHRVTVIYDGKKYSGNCIGVDPEEGLILQIDDGPVRMFGAKQTSIQKN